MEENGNGVHNSRVYGNRGIKTALLDQEPAAMRGNGPRRRQALTGVEVA